jgi:CSLREA domain-containing protein
MLRKFKFAALVLFLTMVFGAAQETARAQSPADVAIMQNLRDNHGFGQAFGWSTTTNPCTNDQNWTGVSCRNQRVSSISVSCGNTPLPAPFPGTEIAGLTALINLELRACYFNQQPASNLAALDTMTQLASIRIDSSHGITGNLSDMFPQGLSPTRFPALKVFWIYQTPLGGQIPAGLTQFGSAASFSLYQMRLSGTLPATGNPSILALMINGNALEGVLPDYIRNASGFVRLGYNKFDVAGTPPGSIDTIDPGWRDTQTVPPTNVQIAQTGAGTATLTWTPIAYTAHGGYYEVLSSQTPGGAYVSRGTTADSGGKAATGLTVSGLPAGTNYFVVRAFTPAHTRETVSCLNNNGVTIDFSTTQLSTCAGGQIVFAPNNPNDLTSVNSAETSANIPPPLTVTKTADTNDGVCDADCSLREAIAAANGTSANDQIIFAIPPTDANCPNGVCTITLVSGQLTINSAATAGTLSIFNATGAANLRVSGNNQSRVFRVNNGGNLTLDNLTVTNGRLASGSNYEGAGISNLGALSLNNCVVTNNSAATTSGSLSARGAGINSSGTLNITNSTVSFNSMNVVGGVHAGGGIHHSNGTMTITNSTVSNNSINGSGVAISSGGGISVNSGTATLRNTTVAANSSISQTANSARGGGINRDSGTVNLQNSIIAGNSVVGGFGNQGIDVSGAFVSLGNNLIGDSGGASGFIASDITNQNALLAPLGFYGGATPTHALTANSPAVNAGSNSEIQMVTPPASGSFRLIFNGFGTAELAFDASPAAVEAALVGNLLTNGAGAGNVSVTKPGASYIIAFQGALADINLPPITATGGATVQTLVDGKTAPPTDQRGAARNGNVDIGAFEIEPDTDGDGVRDLTDNCPTTPNPEKIAFTSDRHGNSEIYVMNPDGSNQTRLTNNPGSNFFPSFSPDGSKIVFGSARDGNSEIYVMNSDGSNQTRLTSNTAVDTFPAFSPDGSKIVFTSHRDGNLEIYVMNSDGSNQTRLTNNSANDDFPSFSPDGTKIVFVSLRDGGNFEIYVMNPDGSNQTRLTNNTGGNSFPSFSPDGSKIVYTSFGKIYVMNSDGSNQTRLTNISGNDISPSFSPDGTKIAFVSTRSSYFEIYVMNSDGSNQTRLTNPGTEDYKPSWGRQADADGDGIGDACEVPDDTTPPFITPTVTGTLGNNDWYVSDVEVSFSVIDDESTVSNQTGCDLQTVSVDTDGVTFTCQATSAGGTSSQSVTVKRDATAPSITFDSRTAPNSAGWNNTNVIINWSCSDTMSGAVGSSVSQTLMSEGTNQSSTGTCTDNAGNSAQDTQSGINIDKTAPTLAPTVSPNPVLLNGSATASPNASDALSGVVSSSCDSPNTSSVGNKTLNCTATDNAGNSANALANYRVAYNFTGFFQPIENLPTVNVATAESAIPVKFSLGGYHGLNIFAAGYPISSPVACNASEPGSTIDQTVSAGGSYDAATDRYTYVWKTNKAWKGTCRMLVVRFVDGREHYAKFRFR